MLAGDPVALVILTTFKVDVQSSKCNFRNRRRDGVVRRNSVASPSRIKTFRTIITIIANSYIAQS